MSIARLQLFRKDVPQAISNGGLNTSLALDAYTPVLSTPSSMGALVPHERCSRLPRLPQHGMCRNGCLFLGAVSSLDAFSSYLL
jgi:hypothetical protein